MQLNKQQHSLPVFLKNIYVILCSPSHPANIGATARAMKTMGLSRLILVSPNIISTPLTPEPPIFDPVNPNTFTVPTESCALAAGAKDILSQVQIFSSLQESIKIMHITCALTSRRRSITAPLQTPREIMPELIQAAQMNQKIAFVFGSETFGLSIEEVALCNRLITINGNPEYFSLNLAQAVQVIAYEFFSQINHTTSVLAHKTQLAPQKEVLGLIQHCQTTMDSLGFFHRRNQSILMRKVQRIIHRSGLETDEIDILRGFLSLINQKTKS